MVLVSKSFEIFPTPIIGLNVLQRKPLGDDRGYLERLYCLDELQPLLGIRTIVQINHTLTAKRGTVRGMHFQHPPYAEVKLVSCMRGKVFDVAVDMRRDSPTFLEWHGEILTADNHKTIVIPEGFAHGFQTFTDDCEMFYLHTAAFQPDAEGGLNAKDPKLSIQWPLPITEQSTRDLTHSLLTTDFVGVTL